MTRQFESLCIILINFDFPQSRRLESDADHSQKDFQILMSALGNERLIILEMNEINFRHALKVLRELRRIKIRLTGTTTRNCVVQRLNKHKFVLL